MRLLALGLLASLLTLASCAPAPDAGYTLYQTILIDHGSSDGRRLQVLEDERLTPGMRRLMWGGPKAPLAIASGLGISLQDPTIARLLDPPIRPAMLRLQDASGKTLALRHFDCPLAELNEAPLPQGQTEVWAIGVDCHTGSGNYEGLVTRLFWIVNDQFEWQRYTDGKIDEPIELTLLNSPKIAWHLSSAPRAEEVEEVSGIPDFTGLKPGQEPTKTVIDYVVYRFKDGLWHRTERLMPGDWRQEDGFPAAGAFPRG